jgi:hypothetical protein
VRPVLAVLAASAGVLLLGGCGFDVSQDDDVEPDAGTVRSGLAVLWSGPDPSGEVVAEGKCFADALMDRLSVDELVGAGIVQDNGRVAVAVPKLTVDVASAWVDAAGSCTPYAEVAGRVLASRFEGRLDGASYAACLDGTVSVDRVRAALVASLSGGYGSDPAVPELEAAGVTCAQGALTAG